MCKDALLRCLVILAAGLALIGYNCWLYSR